MFGNSVQQIVTIMKQDMGDSSAVIGNLGAKIANAMRSNSPRLGPMGFLHRDGAKLAYIWVLNKAIKKASRQTSFNLETAINDLWIKLDGVRALDQRADSRPLASMFSETKELIEGLGKLFDKK